MATITNTVQTLIDKINDNQNGGAALTPEETLLLTKSVQALAENQDFEQALIAVAEGHLNTAEQSMASARTQMSAELANANANLNASTTNLDTAKQSLDETSTALTTEMKIISTVNNVLKSLRRQESGQIGNTDLLTYLDGDSEIIDEKTAVTQSIHTIFSDDGQVNICSRSHVQASGAKADVLNCNNWYELPAGSDFMKGVYTRKNYVTDSTNSVRSSHTHRHGYYNVTGEYPLASSTDANDIKFSMLIADYSATAQNTENFRGIGIYFDANYGVAVGHYNTELVKDQYGRWATQTTNRNGQLAVTAFYDNSKNCLVVIQDLKVWQLYSDGWKDPNITTFANVSFAQAWVDEQPDMFLVALCKGAQDGLYQPWKFNSFHDKSQSLHDNSMYNGSPSLNRLASTSPGDSDPHSYQNQGGVTYHTTHCGSDKRADQGFSWANSQSYLWEKVNKKLVPMFNECLVDMVAGVGLLTHTNNAFGEWQKFKIKVKCIRMDTMAIIGECTHLVNNKGSGNNGGIRFYDIPQYSPYANAWLFIHCIFRNNISYYKLARLGYITDDCGVKGEYK